MHNEIEKACLPSSGRSASPVFSSQWATLAIRSRADQASPVRHLASLDITANRLSGPLPVLRQYFPELTTLLAADNGIEVLSAQALAGLTTVSLANNSIGRLPPEIGLLWHRGLRQLELEGNTFRVPTYATLQRGTEAVMSWLRDKVPAGEVVGLARELGVEGVVEEEEDETF